jgi:hypothetical protein
MRGCLQLLKEAHSWLCVAISYISASVLREAVVVTHGNSHLCGAACFWSKTALLLKLEKNKWMQSVSSTSSLSRQPSSCHMMQWELYAASLKCTRRSVAPLVWTSHHTSCASCPSPPNWSCPLSNVSYQLSPPSVANISCQLLIRQTFLAALGAGWCKWRRQEHPSACTLRAQTGACHKASHTHTHTRISHTFQNGSSSAVWCHRKKIC